MAVTVIFAGSADNDLACAHATYLTARNGLGTFTGPPSTAATQLWNGQLNFGTYTVWQSFLRFPLTAVNAGQTVTAAVMQTWLDTDNSASDFLCIALEYDWGAVVNNADWRTIAQHAGQTWYANISTSGIGAAGAYKSWSDGPEWRDWIMANLGGQLHLHLATDQMVAGNAPPAAQYVVWSSTDVAGTTQDPKLTLTHVQDLVAEPAVTGLVMGGESDVTFEFPAESVVTAGVVLELDLDNDGVFEVQLTDGTMALDTLTGRDFPSGLTGETKPGQLKATINNEAGRFSYSAPTPVGRPCRFRAEEAVNDDPVLLARDRFSRADGSLGSAETGQPWTVNAGAFTVRTRTAASGTAAGMDNAATIDVGASDVYVQASLRQLVPTGNDTRHIGVYARYTDTLNYIRVAYNTLLKTVRISQNNAGAFSTIATSTGTLNGYEGMTVGLSVVGAVATAYMDGVAVCSGAIAAPAGTRAGVFAIYGSSTGRSAELADFHVWDKLITDTPGILWTGDVSDLVLNVDVLGKKVATLSADGQLVRAAGTEVASPRLIAGAPTGVLIGNVLHRAGLLHPPAPLDLGAVTTGPVGIDDGKALDLARTFEDTEQGFIYEPPEGGVSFQSSTARAAEPLRAWFSDTPGVGQFPFHRVEPAGRRAQLINRVTAGVAPSLPSGVSWTQVTGGGHVDITLPTVTEGDLLLVFVASSQNGGQDWLTPIWWESHRDLKGALGMRIYSHWCNATDTGTVWRLRQWNGAEVGVWAANIIRIQNWFKGNDAIVISEPASGDDPNGMAVPWGRQASLFLAFVAGFGGTPGSINYAPTLDPPDGYDWLTGIGVVAHGVADAQDVGLVGAHKYDVTDSENPTAFLALSDTVIKESIVVGVRGYNGPHTKATLDDPNIVGGDGRFVTVDNLDSQSDYNAVLSHREPSNLFASEADAQTYGDSIVEAYGVERPILTLSFWVTKRASMRALRLVLRVGHKVRVTASGATGLDTDADFYVEAIGDTVSAGGTLWEATLWLSPA